MYPEIVPSCATEKLLERWEGSRYPGKMAARRVRGVPPEGLAGAPHPTVYLGELSE